MKPTTLNILGIEYSILYVDKPSDVDIHGRDVAWGQIDYWTRSIRIYDKDREIADIWQTLIHEILHAIGETLHLKINEEEMHNELDIIAVALTDVLTRNGILKITDTNKRSRTKES